MQRYKEIERVHYDARARTSDERLLAKSGPAAVPTPLRTPYVAFESAIRAHAKRGSVVVDLGAGTGIHSLAAREAAVRVPVDISLPALALAGERGRRSGIPVAAVVADAENLPLRAGSTDLVTSAGALYCFDFPSVCAEVRRVLKPAGQWVIVDSFDHNPIYRLNRRIGRLLGRRTRRAVANIPRSSWLDVLRLHFARVEVRYFGTVAFLAPALRVVVGDDRAAAAIDGFDRLFPQLHRYAFKIVVCATGPLPA